MELIDLSIDEARRIKFEVGRQKYGGDQFVGDPLSELHDELIDATNYVEEAQRRGHQMGALDAQLRAMVEQVRALYAASR